MYGIEVGVILFACVFSIVALWTSPWWMRLLARLYYRLSGQLERVDGETDKDLAVFPKEEK
jgi:hypothetical protein